MCIRDSSQIVGSLLFRQKRLLHRLRRYADNLVFSKPPADITCFHVTLAHMDTIRIHGHRDRDVYKRQISHCFGELTLIISGTFFLNLALGSSQQHHGKRIMHGDCSNRTVEFTGTAVPAFVGIKNLRLLSLNHRTVNIQRTYLGTGSTTDTF